MRPDALRRREFSLAAVFVGSPALLVACRSGQPSSPTTAPASAPAPTSPPASNAAAPAVTAPNKTSSVTTISYWSFFPSDNSRWSERPMILGEFEGKNNVKFDINFVPDAQFDAKVQTGFAAKQLPDLMDHGGVEAAIGWGRQGIVIDLSDVLNKLGKDDFAKALLSAEFDKGKIYGLPWMANPQLMYYRKDWAADKGLKVTTWDEWLVFAKTFTGKNPAGKDGYGTGGFMAPVHQTQWIQDWLGPNDGLTFDEKWNVVLDTLKQNFESLDYMNRMSAYFQPGAINNNYGDTGSLYTDEVLALALSSTTFVNGVIKNKPQLVDKTAIQAIPTGPSGKGDRGAFLGCYSWNVASTSKQQDLTKQFLEWIMDPPNYIRVFKTIDFGHVPVRLSVATDPKLATLVPPLAMETIQAGSKVAQIATLPGEDFGPNGLARQISAQNIWSSMAQKVLTGSADAALKWGADEIRKIVKDDPKDLG